MLHWIVENWAILWGLLATILLFVSESLPESSTIKSNSIFRLIQDFLRGEVKKAKPALDKLVEH